MKRRPAHVDTDKPRGYTKYKLKRLERRNKNEKNSPAKWQESI